MRIVDLGCVNSTSAR